MHCAFCATWIEDNCRFCPKCGQPTNLNSASEPEDVLPSAPSQGDDPEGVFTSDQLVNDKLPSRALTRESRELLPAQVSTSHAPVRATGDPGKRLNSHTLHALLTQANLHRLRSQWSEATDCCVAVLRAHPGNQTAHSLLGDIYRDQGRLDDAIQWYRMAVDLRPNPADEAKLAQIEREREQLQQATAERRRLGYSASTAADPLMTAAELNAGTSNLMGISPRRWLRGIWVISFTFLALVLALLMRMQPLHRTPARTNLTTNAGFGGGSALPPQYLQHNPGSMALTTPPSGAAAGTGIRPDASAAGMTPATTPQRNPAPSKPAPPIPTAPILNVEPLNTGPVVSAPRDHAAASSHNDQQVTPLTGNMHIEQVQDAGDSVAAVLVSAPAQYETDASASTREIILRNIYRAARAAFVTNSAYTKTTVIIQAQVPGIGDAAIIEASLDRDTAMAANPETDSPDSLQQHLQSLRWPGQNTTSPPTNSSALQGGSSSAE